MRLLAIDPGGTVGYAYFNAPEPTPVDVGQVRAPSFNDWLNEQEASILVVEAYLLNFHNPNEKFKWDKGITLKQIGAIEFHARRLGAIFEEQPPNILPVAFGQMGGIFEKGKSPHYMAAIAHGFYFISHSFSRLQGA